MSNLTRLWGCRHVALVGALVSVVMLVGASTTTAVADQTGTHVSGTISADTTWTLTGSPYTLDDNTTIGSGATLTVDPGVVIEGTFRLNAVGVLHAVGTPADPITFSVTGGLHFYPGSLGSQVEWATVEGSTQFGVSTESAGPAPTLDHDVFRSNNWGVWYQSIAQGSASVTSSKFIGNSGGAIYNNVDLALDQVRFSDGWDMYQHGGSLLIQNSNFSAPNNGTCASGPSGGGNCTIYVTGGGPISAGGDWWGTTDQSAITQHIWDGNDDPSLAAVSTAPIATAAYDLYPPTSAPSVLNGSALATTVGSITGTAADDPTASTGVDHVEASLQDLETGTWWDGSHWVASQVFLPTTGSDNWQLPIPTLTDADQYMVRSMAYDAAGNPQWGATSRTFTAEQPPSLIAPYDFGSVVIGDHVTHTLSGTTAVTDPAETITSITWPIAGSDYPTDDLGVFVIDSDNSTCAPGVTVDPGSGCTLVVDASSRWPQSASEDVVVNFDNGDSWDFPLTATFIFPPTPPQITPGDFIYAPGDYAESAQVVVTNTGPTPTAEYVDSIATNFCQQCRGNQRVSVPPLEFDNGCGESPNVPVVLEPGESCSETFTVDLTGQRPGLVFPWKVTLAGQSFYLNATVPQPPVDVATGDGSINFGIGDSTATGNYDSTFAPAVVTVTKTTSTGTKIVRHLMVSTYGRHPWAWHGRNDAGGRVAAGTYQVTVTVGGKAHTRKVVVR